MLLQGLSCNLQTGPVTCRLRLTLCTWHWCTYSKTPRPHLIRKIAMKMKIGISHVELQTQDEKSYIEDREWYDVHATHCCVHIYRQKFTLNANETHLFKYIWCLLAPNWYQVLPRFDIPTRPAITFQISSHITALWCVSATDLCLMSVILIRSSQYLLHRISWMRSRSIVKYPSRRALIRSINNCDACISIRISDLNTRCVPTRHT